MFKIDNPDTYQLGTIVEKISKTGFTSNKRLLVLKTGMLFYYSNVPKEFKSDVKNLEGLNLKQLPKSSIQIRHILNIKSDPKKPKDLSIFIEAQNIYERQDILRKSGLSDEIGQAAKNNKTVIEWSFTFPNSQHQKTWVKSLEFLKQHFKKQNDNVDKFFQSFNTDKKRTQSPRRASQKIQVGNRVSTDNKYRQSEFDASSKGIKKLNIIQQQQEQNKQQQIQRQIKLREEKLKRDIEQKIRKQYENKMIENNKLMQIQRQKKMEKQQQQLQKQKILYEKQIQIKKLQQELRKRIQQEQIKNRQLKQKQQELKKSQQIQKSLQEQNRLQAQLRKKQEKKEEPKKLLTQKSMINITKSQDKIPLTKKEQNKSIFQQKNTEIIQQKNSSVKLIKNIQESKSLKKLPQKQQYQIKEKITNRNQIKNEIKSPTLKTSPTEPLISNSINQNTKSSDKLVQVIKKVMKKQRSKKELLEDILSPNQTVEQINETKQYKKKQTQKFYLEREIKKQLQQNKNRKSQKKQYNTNPNIPQKNNTINLFTEQKSNKIQILNENQKIQQQIQFKKINQLKQDFYNEFQSNLISADQTEKINYFELQNNIFKQSFEDKLQNQITLIKYIKSLKRQAMNLFKNIIQEIQVQNPNKKYKIINNCFTDKNFNIQLGYCHTNIINLKGKDEYIYDQASFKNFRRYFQVYNQLQNKIITLLKKKPYFSLRVPIVFYLQYRGICGLVTHVKNLNKEFLQQEMSENLIKQLNLITDSEQSDYFTIRKTKSKQNINILFLRESYKIKKPKYFQFNFPVTPFFLSRTNKLSLSTHTIKNLKYNINQNPIPENLEKIEALQLTEFCKNIRKVYRAGQAQLNDEVFWKLVLKKDQNIFNMLESNLSNDFPNKGIVLQYLRQFLNIDIYLQKYQELLNFEKISKIQINMIALEYKFNTMQVCQIIDNFDKYLKQNKVSLAKKSIAFKQKICDPNQSSQIQKYLTDKINLLYFQRQYSSCLNQILVLFQYIPYTSPTKLKFYQILFNCYKNLNQYSKFISTFKQAVQYVHIVFGHHPYLITLYCLIAQYVSTYGNIDESLELYKYALDLSNKIYNNQQLSAEMYIQMSNIYLNSKNFQQTVQLLNIILQLYQQVPQKSQTQAKLNTHVSTLYYLMGNFADCQKLLRKAIQFYENENSSRYISEQLFQCYLLYITYFELNHGSDIIKKICLRSKNDSQNIIKLICVIIKKLLQNTSNITVQSTIQMISVRSNKNKIVNKQKWFAFLNENENILLKKIEESFDTLILGQKIQNNLILDLIGEDKMIQILKSKS